MVVIIDATYFSRKNGVLVARDPLKKENLHGHEIVSETKEEYRQAKVNLERLGYTLQAVVLDGRTGIPRVFEGLPVQICHWRQWQIVRRKLTLKPKLPAHQALFSIGRQIGSVTEKKLGKLLDVFQKHFRKDLEEKTYTEGTNRPRYTHAKLRSAYGSLRRNLPNLYTYQKYPELKIPNTTNSLDGSFNALKSHINVHRGLNKNRRAKIIKSYLRL
ncbi:MAG: transposase [Candidatus Vogelbacteria bacterium]